MAVEEVHLELARVVEEQMGRFGVAGRVDATTEGRAKQLCLVGHGPRALLDITTELETYRTATELDRRRLIERLARELASRRRASVPATLPRPGSQGWIRPVLGLLGVAGALAASWVWLGRPARDAIAAGDGGAVAEPSLASSVAASKGRSTLTQADLVTRCSAAKARISMGGTVGPLDVDGWVVEIMLLSPLANLTPTADALRPFIAEAPSTQSMQVVWADAPELTSDAEPATFVVVSPEPLATVVPDTRSGVRITLSGKYVTRYFEEPTRLSLVRLAAALYEASRANVGALYARCATGKTHHLGSWFRGADLATSSLALVAAMGLYSDVPHLVAAGFSEEPWRKRRALSAFRERSNKLERSRLTMLLGDDGGMLAGRPGMWATITFPFKDGNRATRASLRLTRAAGLGPR